ncbi:hypothetical protein EX30DRAFT_373645 [Ascodesmis nigricans]|uniref:Uncharacterized protein n=1 Tax=Ascodesmis nigricans TaxID=341454 RepID=A0A4S2MNB0_9PEZI|nr:hypothetical protein EX30DRAFT_373645 [Ascodesmis nigricans]
MSSDADRSGARIAGLISRFERPMPAPAQTYELNGNAFRHDDPGRPSTSRLAPAEQRIRPRLASSTMRQSARTPSPVPIRSFSPVGVAKVGHIPAAGTKPLKMTSHSTLQEWDQWLPEHGGPRELGVGMRPLSRAGESNGNGISSRLLDSPDFMVKGPRSGQSTPHKRPTSLRVDSTETIPLSTGSDKSSYLIDPKPEELYRRMQQAQLQRGRPHMARTFSDGTGSSISLVTSNVSRSIPSSPEPDYRRRYNNAAIPRHHLRHRRSISTPPIAYSRQSTPASDNTSTSTNSYTVGEEYPAYAVEYIKRETVATPDSGYSGSDESRISVPRMRQRDRISSPVPQIPYTPPSKPLSFEFGGDAQIDARPSSGPRAPQSVNRPRPRPTVNDYSPEATRRPRGGVNPQIEHWASRSSTSGRSPGTTRTPVPYSRANRLDPSMAANPLQGDANRLNAMSRRTSYSSVTGISPVPDTFPRSIEQVGNHYPKRHTLPRSSRSARVLKVDTQGPHLDRTLSGHTTSPASPIATMNGASRDIDINPVLTERRKVSDFDFVNTLGAISRPYTPDKFAMDLLNSQKETLKKRSSSRRSIQSLASFGALSRNSDNEPVVNAPAPTPQKNVLRKVNSGRSTRLSFDDEKIDPHILTSPAPAKNVFHGVEPDVYMTDIPSASTKVKLGDADWDDPGSPRSSINPEGGESERIKNRPSLFKLLDCTLSAPALSGLSVELARVSHQIHGDPEKSQEQGTGKKSPPYVSPTMTIRTEPPQRAPPEVPTGVVPSAASAPSIRNEKLETPPRSRFLFVTMFRESRLFVRQSLSSGFGAAKDTFRERRHHEKMSDPALLKKHKLPSKSKNRFMSFGRSKKRDSIDTRYRPSSGLGVVDGSADTSHDSPGGTDMEKKSIHDLVSTMSLVGTDKQSAFHEDLKPNGKSNGKDIQPLKTSTELARKSHRPSVVSLRWRPSSMSLKETVAS